MSTDLLPGQSYPLGATLRPEGVNFSVFSRNCTAMELLLFDHAEDARPSRVIQLDPRVNRTFYYWHVLVKDIGPGQLYGYRARGPFAPEMGLRYDGSKLLTDPYARAVTDGGTYQREAAARPGDNCGHAWKSVVVDPRDYDWEGDIPLRRPVAGSLIYEMHVGGFTRHPSSGVSRLKRGTYAGLIEKIPYLQSLGITSVELLPVQQFDAQDAPHGLSNYWGYSPLAFFAPHREYSSRQDAQGPVYEFRDMVKALHQAGIEVILDVVFNHTAEGNHTGPTLSFRGLENRAYYILEQYDKSRYANYSGTGNTINANHSVIRRLILDCLHYWVQEMHVDGFRFDLASVLSRGPNGQPLADPPVLWEIESDPVLAGTKIIAEAWDAAGLYQVGSFIGHRWAEWNGQFRDDLRRFIKGDNGTVAKLAERLTASRDVYRKPGREPNRSINFVTCHDGFTLNDLVSYNYKHNAANREGNRDGTNANFSWNCGVEGPSDNPAIDALRLQQIKNMLAILLISQGTPMLLMGDEVRRSQGGNNNAYCQNNELSWFDWTAVDTQAELLRFVRLLIRFTQGTRLFHEERFWNELRNPHVIWHGVQLYNPDWAEYSHSLAFELTFAEAHEHLYVMLNAYWEPLTFDLPPLERRCHWHRLVDTALASPNDCADLDSAPPVQETTYRVAVRSVVVLVEKRH